MDPYATHQQFLKWYIEKTDGDIIEFGCGDGSTGLILDLIKGTNRKLLSLENDPYWLSKMFSQYPPSDTHEYVFVDDSNGWKETISKLNKYSYQVVFIDQSPWEARVWALDHFLSSADYIIVHDVDYFPTNNIFGKIVKHDTDPPQFDFSDKFKKWALYYPPEPWPAPTGPPTLVGSNKDYTTIETPIEIVGSNKDYTTIEQNYHLTYKKET